MHSIAILVILTLVILIFLLFFSWFGYHFGYRILDAFSPVKSGYGIVVEKKCVPPHSKIINNRVVHSHDSAGFGPTSYDIPDEVQVAEECLFHINLNGRLIVTHVTGKLYDSVNQDEQIFVKYSQGRFSGKIYLKKLSLLKR